MKKQRKIARGKWQKEIFHELTMYGKIDSPLGKRLKGKARNYFSKYSISFKNLLNRMNENGYEIKRIPGKLGGEYTAVYYLINSYFS